MNAIKNTKKQAAIDQKGTFLVESITFPKLAKFGDEKIELDESMFYGKEYLCPECRELGYCQKKGF